MSPLFNGLTFLTSVSSTKLLSEIFTENSNLDHSSDSLPGDFQRTGLKLCITFLTTNMFTKVITALDSSKAAGSDRILAVFQTDCKPEL